MFEVSPRIICHKYYEFITILCLLFVSFESSWAELVEIQLTEMMNNKNYVFVDFIFCL